MRKITALLLVLVMALSLCACGDKDKIVEETVKIGVFQPLSGSAAPGGMKETLGIEYAHYLVPSFDMSGVRYNIELVYADNCSNLDEAVIAAQKLVNAGVSVVIGSYGSDYSIAASSVFEKAGVPVIGASCTNPQVTEGNDHYFRVCCSDKYQGKVIASFATSNLNIESVYCLAESGSEYSSDLKAYFSEAFSAKGGMIYYDTFPVDCSDFTYYIERAKSLSAGGVVLLVNAASAAGFLAQAAEMGLSAAVVGCDTLDDAGVLQSVTGSSIKLYVSTFYCEGINSTFDKGFKDYVNQSAERLQMNGGTDDVSTHAAMGFDAYNVALEAMKKVGSTAKEDVLAILPGVKFTGVAGTIYFDDDGSAMRETVYFKRADTENGVWNGRSVTYSTGN